MQVTKKRVRIAAVGMSTAALLFFVCHQYTSFQTSAGITRQQLQVIALRGQLPDLDESMTMSSRLYVLTGDCKWKERYYRRLARYDSVYTAIQVLLPLHFAGKQELDSAAARMLRLEAYGFALAEGHHRREARLHLFGKDYDQHRRTYKAGLRKLDNELHKASGQLMRLHRRQALKSSLLLGIVILLIFAGGLLVFRLNRKWQHQLVEANRLRVEEARRAEKIQQRANEQLHLLFRYWQEATEKKRLAIAHDMHEELGQQLAVIKISLDRLASPLSASPGTGKAELRAISGRLSEAINFLQKLATDVYPLVLRDLGLVEALRWESNRVAEQSGAAVLFSCEQEDLKLDQHRAAVLFRIYQEKLRSLTLQGASEILCSLRVEENSLVFSLYDDSKAGSNVPLMEDEALKERLLSIGGTHQISNSPDEGNCCFLSMPLNLAEKHFLEEAWAAYAR